LQAVATRVLFVCLGNICRSPLAEAAFRAEAERVSLDVEIDKRHGVDIDDLRARQIKAKDFYHFDHVVALDLANLRDLRALKPPNAKAELSLLLDHVAGREGKAVVDPYYGEADHFDLTWADVAEGAVGLAKALASRK
jgi:protein-tyrosine phosphatase